MHYSCGSRDAKIFLTIQLPKGGLAQGQGRLVQFPSLGKLHSFCWSTMRGWSSEDFNERNRPTMFHFGGVNMKQQVLTSDASVTLHWTGMGAACLGNCSKSSRFVTLNFIGELKRLWLWTGLVLEIGIQEWYSHTIVLFNINGKDIAFEGTN